MQVIHILTILYSSYKKSSKRKLQTESENLYVVYSTHDPMYAVEHLVICAVLCCTWIYMYMYNYVCMHWSCTVVKEELLCKPEGKVYYGTFTAAM